jgi:hypothetical protein
VALEAPVVQAEADALAAEELLAAVAHRHVRGVNDDQLLRRLNRTSE